MRILIADDDNISLRLLDKFLVNWKYETVQASNGAEAWQILSSPNAPYMAILDWNMPEMEGVEVCRKVRENESQISKYLIILTSRNTKEDIAKGLNLGANDYIEKPFNSIELKARLNVGKRVLQLQQSLHLKIKELRDAAEHIKTLQGIIPICMHCHKIRSDDESWHKIDAYLEQHTEVEVSHGLCLECLEKYYPDNK